MHSPLKVVTWRVSRVSCRNVCLCASFPKDGKSYLRGTFNVHLNWDCKKRDYFTQISNSSFAPQPLIHRRVPFAWKWRDVCSRDKWNKNFRKNMAIQNEIIDFLEIPRFTTFDNNFHNSIFTISCGKKMVESSRFTAIPEWLFFCFFLCFFFFVLFFCYSVILLKWDYYSFQILAKNWLCESETSICWSLRACLFVILTKTFQWIILSTNASKLFIYTTYLRSL